MALYVCNCQGRENMNLKKNKVCVGGHRGRKGDGEVVILQANQFFKN